MSEKRQKQLRDRIETSEEDRDTIDPGSRPRAPQIAFIYSLTSWQWTGDVTWGASQACLANHYELLLVHYNRDEAAAETERVWSLCDRGNADGVVILQPSADNEAFKRGLERRSIPYAVIEPIEQGRDALSVEIDNKLGSCASIEHLLDLGHRRIGYILGAPGLRSSTDRYLGYVQSLSFRGISVDDRLVVHGSFHPDSARKTTPLLLDLARPPTAIVCANDEMARASLEIARERGLTVPKDLSIVGFDDSETSRMTYPNLTTVRQPRTEMGKTAAQLVIDALRGESRRRNVILPVELCVRDSTTLPSRNE